MKICFLGLGNLPVLAQEFSQHGVGGEEVQHCLLAKALRARGHIVSMVVADYGQPDAASWDGITVYKAYAFAAGLPIFRFAHPRWTGVWAALRRADAEVYYVSCAGMHLGLLAMFCARYRRGLVFRMAHDSDAKPQELIIPHWRDKKLYGYGLRRTDVVLAQSENQRVGMLANYGVASRVAGMLVDSGAVVGTLSERTGGVLWVNNLRQFKRPDLAMDLAALLPDREFDMIGGPQAGFESLFAQTQQRAAEMPQVRFWGRVPYQDIGPYYGQARVFINTSDTEGFPNSFLQAWVRGTPVVSFFDPDGLIEREGLGFRATTIDEMAAKVNRLVNEPELWHAVSQRCLRFMAQRYGDDTVLVDYLGAFAAAIQKRHSGVEARPAGRA